jgi:ribosomal 30S subunit maturation factor RimM
MAFVSYKGKEVLIPMINAFLKEINKKDNRILVDLPEGMI